MRTCECGHSSLEDFNTWQVVRVEDRPPYEYYVERSLCSYSIEGSRLLKEMDWLNHLRQKEWFTKEEELDFLRATYRCLILMSEIINE